MISAGQQQLPGNIGGQPARSGNSPGSINFPSYTPLTKSNTGYGVNNWNIKLKEDGDIKDAMSWQGGLQAGQMVTNMMSDIFNYSLAGQAMSAQESITKKYYSTQDNIAKYQRDVALKQLGVQETAVFVQQSMHKTQTQHEKDMMKLEGSMQARLAQIHENGKTSRAKVFLLQDAFAVKNNWSYGNPVA